MIISKKNQHRSWRNLKGYSSRLSGPYYHNHYVYSASCHRLYGRSIWVSWDLNNKVFIVFKEIYYDKFI